MKSQYFIKNKNSWIHVTPLKKIINPILRKIQFWTNSPVVIASECDMRNDVPIFKYYKLCRVKYR